mmetsp:Transcript_3618/g.7460  ORF Transcript_3618/g.7460 Transcript_3618/m.7460 type:complete len:297 (-) Transcript_3618:326-1216(-)
MNLFRFNFPNCFFSCCTFSSDGNSIFAGKNTGEVLWMNNDNKFQNFKTYKLHKLKINKIIVEQDFLFSVSWDSLGLIWDLKMEKKIRTLSGHKSSINDIDRKNNLIITMGQDGILRIWDDRVSEVVEKINHGFNLLSGRFLTKEFTLASCGFSSEIFIWDLRNLKGGNQRLNSLKGNKNYIVSFSFSRKNSMFFSLDRKNCLSGWLLQGNRIFFKQKNSFKKGFHEQTSRISCDFTGKFFSIGGNFGESIIFFQKTGKIYKKFKDHIGSVKDVCFHPKKKFLCSLGNDETFTIRNF